MDRTKHTFRELSDLEYEVHTCPFINQPKSKALIVSFRGEYGVGTGGNQDARFMTAVIRAALTAWWCRGLILDLRQMRYEWGDAILDAFDAGKLRYTFAPFPTAIVVSALNRTALSSLIEDVRRENSQEWLFDTFEEALVAVEEKEERNQQSIKR